MQGYGGGDEVRLFQKHFEGSCIALGVGKNRPAIASRILQQRGVRRLEDRETITSSHADAKSDSQSGTSLEPPLGVAILDDGLQASGVYTLSLLLHSWIVCLLSSAHHPCSSSSKLSHLQNRETNAYASD